MGNNLLAGTGMHSGFDPATASQLNEREQSLVARRAKVLGPSYQLMYEHPVEFVRGEGVYLYDNDGNAYLDCYNNVCSVGHCNPNVVAAVTKQLGTLNTHTRYMNDVILNYSEQLLETFEPELSRVMYTCSASESVDLAMRVAKYYTNGTGIIVTDYAYHGTTASVAAISTTMGLSTPLELHARTVPPPYAYRAPEGCDIGQKLADDIEAAIADMERHGIKFAAFLADQVFSTDGLLTGPPGFLQKAIDVVHKHGGVYIADEVQPGFGRTGTHMWGYQRHNIVPDLVVFGKPMGNGFPVAGMVARPEVLDPFGKNVVYFNTFGGNPVSIAAAQAVLNEIQGGLLENCRVMGEYILDGFRKIQQRWPQIGDVRGAGMYFAVEFVKDRATKEPDGDLAKKVVGEMRERRVLIGTVGKAGNSLKIRPILCFNKANADQLLTTLEDSLNAIFKEKPASVLSSKQTALDNDFAKATISKYYGIHDATIKKMPSERDQTFRAVTEAGKFLIKFANPSEDQQVTNLQTELMHYINEHDPSIPVQQVIPSLSGKCEIQIDCKGSLRIVRVVSFLEGDLLAEADKTCEQALNLGKVSGKISKCLREFKHPAQNHDLHWDLQNASDLYPYLETITEPQLKAKMIDIYTIFEKRVKPRLEHMRKQVVHNDVSPYNALVDPQNKNLVVGVLDFGDAVYTALVNDVAIGAYYQLGVGSSILDGPLAYVKGYDSEYHLLDDELDLLYDLILVRIFVNTVISIHLATQSPENKTYLLRQVPGDTKYLEALLAYKEAPQEFFRNQLRAGV